MAVNVSICYVTTTTTNSYSNVERVLKVQFCWLMIYESVYEHFSFMCLNDGLCFFLVPPVSCSWRPKRAACRRTADALGCSLRARSLSRVPTVRSPLQTAAFCPCSSARAAKVRTRSLSAAVETTEALKHLILVVFLQLNRTRGAADEGLLGPDLSLSSCVVDLAPGPCRGGACSRALVHFSPITDSVREEDRTTNVSVKPVVTQNFLWNGYCPEPVQVNLLLIDNFIYLHNKQKCSFKFSLLLLWFLQTNCSHRLCAALTFRCEKAPLDRRDFDLLCVFYTLHNI